MLDHVNPEHHLRSMIGYHLAWENSLIGMVMVQGKQREVINIGLGIKQVAVEPRDVTVPQYVESLSHKVCVAHVFFFFFCLFRHHEAAAGSIPHPPAHPPLTRHPNTVNLARNVLPDSGPRRRSRPPSPMHPPSPQSGLHQSDRSAHRL